MTQLDPMAMSLFRRHDMIPAETLRELAAEIEVTGNKNKRMLFIIAPVYLAFSANVAALLLVFKPLRAAGYSIRVPDLVLMPTIVIGPGVI